jgi:hypothetical protein
MGTRLWSIRGVAVTSIVVFAMYVGTLTALVDGATELSVWARATGYGVTFIIAIAAFLPGAVATARRQTMLMFALMVACWSIAIAAIAILHGAAVGSASSTSTPQMLPEPVIGVVAGVAAILFEAAFLIPVVMPGRYWLRHSVAASGTAAAVLMIIVPAFLAWLLIWPVMAVLTGAIFLAYLLESWSALTAGIIVIVTHTAALVVPLLFIAFAALMLLHRVLWPIASRLVYGLQRHNLVSNKRTLRGLSIALWAVALSPGLAWHTVASYFG